jgi:hypothetical protein
MSSRVTLRVTPGVSRSSGTEAATAFCTLKYITTPKARIRLSAAHPKANRLKCHSGLGAAAGFTEAELHQLREQAGAGRIDRRQLFTTHPLRVDPIAYRVLQLRAACATRPASRLMGLHPRGFAAGHFPIDELN